MIPDAILSFVCWIATSIALTSVLIASAGVCLAWLFRRARPELIHRGLLVVCLFLLATPVIQVISLSSGIGWFKIEVPTTVSSETVAPTHLTVDSQAARVDVLSTKPLVLVCLATWCFGTIIGVGRILASLVPLRKWMLSTQPCRDEMLIEAVEQITKELGIEPPTLRLAPSSVSPMVIGAIKPVLVLPCDLAETVSPKGLRAILAHECEHIRRRDNFWGVAGLLVRAMYWWNPVVHCLASQMDDACEQACDERAISVTKCVREYAESLLALAKGQSSSTRAIHCQSLLPRRSGLPQRISRMASTSFGQTLPTRMASIGLAAVLCLCVPMVIPVCAPDYSLSASNDLPQKTAFDDDVVYLSLDAHSSMSATELSSAIVQQIEDEKLGLIVDLREPNEKHWAQTRTGIPKVARQQGFSAGLPVVVIVKDHQALSPALRTIIDSSQVRLTILREGSTSDGGINQFKHPVRSRIRDPDPLVHLAMKILRHA